MLCSGAARLRRPSVVVFVATEEGETRRFQGWAYPSDLLSCLLARNEAFRAAYERATATISRWALARPPAPGQLAMLPWASAEPDNAAWLVFEHGTSRRNEFAAEQLLANELAPLEQAAPPGITVVKLRDLFTPVLHTARVDDAATDAVWLKMVLQGSDQYLAVTRHDVFVGLLPRSVAMNAILAGLTAGRSSD